MNQLYHCNCMDYTGHRLAQQQVQQLEQAQVESDAERRDGVKCLRQELDALEMQAR